MTKLRAPLSPCATLLRVVDRIGWQRASLICNRAERTMRHWSDPDVLSGVTFDAALELDREFLVQGGEYPPFLTLYRTRHKAERRALRDERADRLGQIDRAARAAREVGEAISWQMRASQPGASFAERARARRETEEAIAALGHTLPDLEVEAA